MANTYVLTTASGSTAIFSVPFPYINRNDVNVYLNNIQQLTPGNYVWSNDSQIQFFGIVSGGTVVKIERSTSPNSSDVTFQNGAVLTAADLNTAALQNFYRTQELQDELDSYISGGLAAITTQNGNSAEAMIQAASQVVLNSALLASLQSEIGNIDANAQSIIANASSLVTLQAAVDSLTSFGGTGIATAIVNEQTSRIAGDQALAQTISLIGAANGTNTAFVLDESTVLVDGTTTLASKLSGMIASTSSNTSDITTEQTVRASGDATNATAISALSSTVSGNYTTLNSAIGTEASTRASGDSANASLISALTATVNSNNTSVNAAITNEQSVRASGDSANATSISALSTTVAGNTASLSAQASSIGGLSAQYTVKVDVNGHVAGFGLASTAINGTPTSSFIVAANNFAVVDPGNGVTSPIVPFSISGGVVYMENVVIGNALIQNMTITKLTQGSLNADMNIGTGRIVFDNGSYMKVIGTGFGSSNQFIEWYGPHQASFSTCTETNAVSYLKINGSAYFGGALLAGKLTSSVQATVLTTSNVADLGPFSSNGAQITVTASYNFADIVVFSANSAGVTAYNAQTKVNPQAQLQLSRAINGGGFSVVGTYNITGTWGGTAPSVPDSAPGYYTQNMNWSVTYVDNGNVAQNREYKLSIVSWTNVNATCTQNTLSIQSIE